MTNADAETVHAVTGLEGKLGRSEGLNLLPQLGGGKNASELNSVPSQFNPMLSYGQTRAAFDSEFERRYVSWLLQRQRGNVSAAAREAHMNRKHLNNLAKKHGLHISKPIARARGQVP